MMWFFHILWLILVIVLFFLILRRIYYFGMQEINRQEQMDPNQIPSNNQQYYIFTVYGSRSQLETSANASNLEQPSPSYEVQPPPPKYEEVIKSSESYQKPPSYSQV
ncbi:uncharacterized protein LOC131426931 isoform X2 [Malaya genurostris]|uniref:uncharacterized protein LOC131426931 isoform X2 n=1 Tax=Malaya genurostris TaxID=325434 RepID=UPI0026F3A0D9|nr:uncharacterized protein LOC131426931 isoform X2 [Malaya genurostris]